MLNKHFRLRGPVICIGGESRAKTQNIRTEMQEHIDDYFDHLAAGKKRLALQSLATCNERAKDLVTLFDGDFVDG